MRLSFLGVSSQARGLKSDGCHPAVNTVCLLLFAPNKSYRGVTFLVRCFSVGSGLDLPHLRGRRPTPQKKHTNTTL